MDRRSLSRGHMDRVMDVTRWEAVWKVSFAPLPLQSPAAVSQVRIQHSRQRCENVSMFLFVCVCVSVSVWFIYCMCVWFIYCRYVRVCLCVYTISPRKEHSGHFATALSSSVFLGSNSFVSAPDLSYGLLFWNNFALCSSVNWYVIVSLMAITSEHKRPVKQAKLNGG